MKESWLSLAKHTTLAQDIHCYQPYLFHKGMVGTRKLMREERGHKVISTHLFLLKFSPLIPQKLKANNP